MKLVIPVRIIRFYHHSHFFVVIPAQAGIHPGTTP